MRAEVLKKPIRLEIEQQAQNFGVNYCELLPKCTVLAAIACDRATLWKRPQAWKHARRNELHVVTGLLRGPMELIVHGTS